MSFLTCFSRSTFKYPNLVSVARFEECISDLNFSQKGSQSSTLPLNFVIDNEFSRISLLWLLPLKLHVLLVFLHCLSLLLFKVYGFYHVMNFSCCVISSLKIASISSPHSTISSSLSPLPIFPSSIFKFNSSTTLARLDIDS